MFFMGMVVTQGLCLQTRPTLNYFSLSFVCFISTFLPLYLLAVSPEQMVLLLCIQML